MAAPLTSPKHSPPSTGRAQQVANHSSLLTNRSRLSLITHHLSLVSTLYNYARPSTFLIDATATRNVRNAKKINNDTRF
jgi:hypothetical protein